MTSKIIDQIEYSLYEKQRVANLIKRCNDLFPANNKVVLHWQWNHLRWSNWKKKTGLKPFK